MKTCMYCDKLDRTVGYNSDPPRYLCTVTDNYNTLDHLCDVEREHEEDADSVNHPAHYTQGGIECIDALKAATVGLEGIEAVCTANAIKYLWRWKQKNGVEDLDKAIWYAKRLKEEIRNG